MAFKIRSRNRFFFPFAQLTLIRAEFGLRQYDFVIAVDLREIWCQREGELGDGNGIYTRTSLEWFAFLRHDGVCYGLVRYLKLAQVVTALLVHSVEQWLVQLRYRG